MEELRFPIGRFKRPMHKSETEFKQWVSVLGNFPIELERTLNSCTVEQLNNIYRPDGWKVKQVVHHCAESHLHLYCRIKFVLTEENPTIKPYFEDRWAEIVDSTEDDLTSSLAIIKGVHSKIVQIFNSISSTDLDKYYVHPEYNTQFSLYNACALYAWHCQHHLAHIKIGLDNGKKQ